MNVDERTAGTCRRNAELIAIRCCQKIGFDDNPSGLYGPVALSTVRQPLVKMAQESVKELNHLMSKKKAKAEKKILPTELVIRESCRPA